MFFGAPVASPIDYAAEVTRWTIHRQLNDAHCHLIALAAVHDSRNNLIADLEHTVPELDLTAALATCRIALEPSFNRGDTTDVTAPELRKSMSWRGARAHSCFRSAWVEQEPNASEKRDQLHKGRAYNLRGSVQMFAIPIVTLAVARRLDLCKGGG